MNNELMLLRKEQTRLDNQINSIHNQIDNASTATKIVSVAGLAAGILARGPLLATIVISTAYFAPTVLLDDYGNKLNSRLKTNIDYLKNNFLEQEYKKLQIEFQSTESRQRRNEISDILITNRYLDITVQYATEAAQREIDERDSSKDYDYVEPPSIDFDSAHEVDIDYDPGRDWAYA